AAALQQHAPAICTNTAAATCRSHTHYSHTHQPQQQTALQSPASHRCSSSGSPCTQLAVASSHGCRAHSCSNSRRHAQLLLQQEPNPHPPTPHAPSARTPLWMHAGGSGGPPIEVAAAAPAHSCYCSSSPHATAPQHTYTTWDPWWWWRRSPAG